MKKLCIICIYLLPLTCLGQKAKPDLEKAAIKFISVLQRNFQQLDSIMAKMPPRSYITKIPGMDTDFIFSCYEPELILDHIAKAKTRKFYRLYNKAMVSMSFSKYTNLIFTLTKSEDGKWGIDYIGYDDPELYRLRGI